MEFNTALACHCSTFKFYMKEEAQERNSSPFSQIWDAVYSQWCLMSSEVILKSIHPLALPRATQPTALFFNLEWLSVQQHIKRTNSPAHFQVFKYKTRLPTLMCYQHSSKRLSLKQEWMIHSRKDALTLGKHNILYKITNKNHFYATVSLWHIDKAWRCMVVQQSILNCSFPNPEAGRAVCPQHWCSRACVQTLTLHMAAQPLHPRLGSVRRETVSQMKVPQDIAVCHHPLLSRRCNVQTDRQPSLSLWTSDVAVILLWTKTKLNRICIQTLDPLSVIILEKQLFLAWPEKQNNTFRLFFFLASLYLGCWTKWLDRGFHKDPVDARSSNKSKQLDKSIFCQSAKASTS